MGSSPAPPSSASPEFLAVFRVNTEASGVMSFAKFMDLALYHPEVGYYRRKRKRIGYERDTDFFTASTSGPVFGELVVAACSKLLRDAQRDPAAHTFVEIGTEPESSILTGVAHPFVGVRAVGVIDELEISGDCVVF